MHRTNPTADFLQCLTGQNWITWPLSSQLLIRRIENCGCLDQLIRLPGWRCDQPWSRRSHGGAWYLYKIEILFIRKNEYWVISQCDGHVHGTQMSSHMGLFYETHLYASFQTSFSPVLWSSFFLCPCQFNKTVCYSLLILASFQEKRKMLYHSKFYLLGEFSTFTLVGLSRTQQSIWNVASSLCKAICKLCFLFPFLQLTHNRKLFKML